MKDKTAKRDVHFISTDNKITWDIPFLWRKGGNVLFNESLNTFYLQLYGFEHMVKDHSDYR